MICIWKCRRFIYIKINEDLGGQPGLPDILLKSCVKMLLKVFF